jgi:hypothetical protein
MELEFHDEATTSILVLFSIIISQYNHSYSHNIIIVIHRIARHSIA